MKRTLTAWLGLLAVALAAGGAAPAAQAQAVELVTVGSFDAPVFVANPPGDARRLFIVERAGRIRIMRDGATLTQPFLDIAADVSSDGERGLLSVAFPPDYPDSGLFYIYYTDLEGDIRIDEFARSAASADLADPSSRRPVLEIPHPTFGNHNGGQLQFGPDGLLYAGTGDGGGGGDPFEHAQNLGVLLGKLLRIDPRATTTEAYRIPADNPFVGQPGARPEIYAYGLRNPWRFSFDRATGDLTIGDVGQGQVEEVDFVPRGQGAGANFGWDVFEGTQPFEAGSVPAHVPPVLERLHSDGDCSITGGYVVRDPGLSSLVGRYVHGDFCTGALRSALLRQPTAQGDAALGLTVSQLSSFGEDEGGCLYVASLAGQVFRLLETGVPRPLPCPDVTPPETSITDGPVGTLTSPGAAFSFSSTDLVQKFECRLDAGVWAPCSSPASYAALGDGPHTFEVRAVDVAGNADPTPAGRSFAIDTTAPETSITSGIPVTLARGNVSFAFASSEPSSFECRLDEGAFSACSSAASYGCLSDGAHSFQVRAIDAVGHVDATPAAADFTVDTTPPETSIVEAPRATTTATSAIFRFVSSESPARFECRLDSEAWLDCPSTVAYIGVDEGVRTFEARALDVVGNVDPSPARFRFAVRRRAVLRTLQRLAQAVSGAVRRGGRAGLVRGPAVAVPYTPVVGGRVRAVLRGRIELGGRVRLAIVARGTVAFTQQKVRLRLRRTPAAQSLLPGVRRVWLRVTFSGADRDASIRHAKRIQLGR